MKDSHNLRRALASFERLCEDGNAGDLARIRAARNLAAHVRRALPTYRIIEYVATSDLRVHAVEFRRDLASLTEAQNVIARTDPAGRRIFNIEEQQ